SGSVVAIAELRAEASAGQPGRGPAPSTSPDGATADPATPASLSDVRRELEQRFSAAVAERAVDVAVAVALELDTAIASWSHDTLQSNEADLARSALRSMIVRLGELAVSAGPPPAETMAPLVDALLDARAAARSARDWDAADTLRDRLLEAGVEIHDSPEGTTWSLLS
ncbi:MAG TPA: hypothetical protein VM386_04575, partial [Acidimicrobiales bacterium]|nr:hypothetical protein [Acidimicrobiales bacterium]